MNELDRITTDPNVCGVWPYLRGTRVRVTDMLESLANGATTKEVLADSRSRERVDIAVALRYAAARAQARSTWQTVDATWLVDALGRLQHFDADQVARGVIVKAHARVVFIAFGNRRVAQHDAQRVRFCVISELHAGLRYPVILADGGTAREAAFNAKRVVLNAGRP